MIDEDELRLYRKNREQGWTAKQSLDVARNTLHQEFEKKLRGFRVEEDRRNASLRHVWLDEDKYEVTVDYDDDYYIEECGMKIVDEQPGKNEYPRECVTDVGVGRRKSWIIVTDETPATLAEWYSKSGGSKQVAYEKGCESILARRKYYADLYEGDIGCYVVSIKGHGVDECCGGIESDYVDEYIWETIS